MNNEGKYNSVLSPQHSLLLLRRLLLLQCQHSGKLVRRRQPFDHVAVDDERRCGLHPDSVRFLDVFLDSAFHTPIIQAGVEAADIEAHDSSVSL